MSRTRRKLLVLIGTLGVAGTAGCVDDDEGAEAVADIINSGEYDRARNALVEAIDAYELGFHQEARNEGNEAERLFEGLLTTTRREARSDTTRREECLLENLETHLQYSRISSTAIQDAAEAQQDGRVEQADSEHRRAINTFNQAAELAGEIADALEGESNRCDF